MTLSFSGCIHRHGDNDDDAASADEQEPGNDDVRRAIIVAFRVKGTISDISS